MIETLERTKTLGQKYNNDLDIDYLVEEAIRLSELDKDKTAKEHIKDLEEMLAELDEKAKQYPDYADDIAFERKSCLESIDDWKKIAEQEAIYEDHRDLSTDFFMDVGQSILTLDYVEKKHPELKSSINELWQAFLKLEKDYKALTQPQAITA